MSDEREDLFSEKFYRLTKQYGAIGIFREGEELFVGSDQRPGRPRIDWSWEYPTRQNYKLAQDDLKKHGIEVLWQN